jgi:hypothetical protein
MSWVEVPPSTVKTPEVVHNEVRVIINRTQIRFLIQEEEVNINLLHTCCLLFVVVLP